MSKNVFINARSGIGDCIYFSRVVRSLRSADQGLNISIITWAKSIELFEGIENINVIDATQLDNQWDQSKFSLEQKAQKYAALSTDADLYINLQPNNVYDLELSLSKAKKKIGLNVSLKCHFDYDLAVGRNSTEDMFSFYKRSLETIFNINLISQPFLLPLSQNELNVVNNVFDQLNQNSKSCKVVLHPGCAGIEKLWGPLNWGSLANWLIEKKGAQVIILGSDLRSSGGVPILDLPYSDIIQRITGDRCINLAGKIPSLKLLAGIISNVDVYIGLDTGPTHLASELGVTTIDLYHYQNKNVFEAWKLISPNSKMVVGSPMSALNVEDVKRVWSELIKF